MASHARHIPGSPRYRLDLALGRELRRGEQVRWQGMQLARISLMSFGLYIFAVPWTAFALFWTAMAAGGIATMEIEGDWGWLAWAFPLFGLPFIAVGLGMLSVPFLPLWERGKVLYAVTSERVLKLRLGRRLDVKSLPARRIGQVERREGPDGAGSLKLAVSIGTDSDGDRTTEHFEIGKIADVMGAHTAIARLGAEAAAPCEPVSS